MIGRLIALVFLLAGVPFVVAQDYGTHPMFLGGFEDTTTVPSAAIGTPADNWSDQVLAWWDCDTAPAILEADNASVCGAAGVNCDIPEVGTVLDDTTNFREGTGSCNFDSSGDGYTCTDSADTCPELYFGGDITFMTWMFYTTSGGSGPEVFALRDGSQNGGFAIQMSGTTARCFVFAAAQIRGFAGNSLATSTWQHVACRHNAVGGVDPFINGILNIGSQSGSGTMVQAANTTPFNIMDSGDAFPTMRLDEPAIDDSAWDAASIARVAACGIDGKKCTCNVSTPTEYLGETGAACISDTDCRAPAACPTCGTEAICTAGSCRGRLEAASATLPDCNATAPTTL